MKYQYLYKQKMAAQLEEWDAQIDLLEAKVRNVAADMRLKRADELQELRAKQHTAATKMKELEISGGEAWEQVKETADLIWADLKDGVAAAHSKFK